MAGKLQKRRRLIIWLCMAALLRVSALAAQEPQFSLNIDSLNLQRGVSGQIVISMANAQGAQPAAIEGLENFDLLSQSQSTSTSLIQGEAFYQTDLYYTIMPKAAGRFTLKAIVQYNGQTYETNALEVDVSEGSAQEGGAPPDLFVKTNMSHSSAYLGEKIVVTYELYTRYNIESYGFTDYVAMDGMMVGNVPENQLKTEYAYVDGVRYAKCEVKQLILDPIKPGAYTIPSFNLQANVVTSDRRGGPGAGPFGGLGGYFSFSEPVYLQTEAMELMVKPLPTEGKPEDFSGVVGDLRLEGHYSREVVNYGDSFVLQATASGRCNLDGLKKFIAGELPGLTVYETQKNPAESVQDNQYRIEKAFEIILVPERNGFLDVGPISISYFNPATETYEKATIPGTTIEVLGDIPSPSAAGNSPAVPVETVLINQVNYAAARDGLLTLQISTRALYGALAGIAALSVLGAVLLRLRSRKKKGDPALKSLYRQMTAARDANEAYNLLSALMKHCYGLSLKSSSQSAVRSGLPDAGLAARVTGVMDMMESAEASQEKKGARVKDQGREIYRMILSLRKAGGR